MERELDSDGVTCTSPFSKVDTDETGKTFLAADSTIGDTFLARLLSVGAGGFTSVLFLIAYDIVPGALTKAKLVLPKKYQPFAQREYQERKTRACTQCTSTNSVRRHIVLIQTPIQVILNHFRMMNDRSMWLYGASYGTGTTPAHARQSKPAS